MELPKEAPQAIHSFEQIIPQVHENEKEESILEEASPNEKEELPEMEKEAVEEEKEEVSMEQKGNSNRSPLKAENEEIELSQPEKARRCVEQSKQKEEEDDSMKMKSSEMENQPEFKNTISSANNPFCTTSPTPHVEEQLAKTEKKETNEGIQEKPPKSSQSEVVVEGKKNPEKCKCECNLF